MGAPVNGAFPNIVAGARRQRENKLHLPNRNSRRLDGSQALNESNQILYAPLPHLLVDSAHRKLLEVL